MMKKALLLCIVLSISKLSYGLSDYEIVLIHETIDMPDRKFYIESVVDNRVDKKSIGTVQIGMFNKKYAAQLENGFSNALQDYFDYTLLKKDGQIPIILKINKLMVSETTKASSEFGFADISLEFYHGNNLLFSSNQHIEVSGFDVTRLHEENIRGVIKKSLIDFNQSGWYAKYSGKPVNANAIASVLDSTVSTVAAVSNVSNLQVSTTKAEDQALLNTSEKRNSFVLGYQIGGYSMIGFDYEIRMHDYFGLHFGGGLYGYTYGVMIHTNPKRQSSYYNISYKDGGFGMLNTAGLEYGGKLLFNKKSGFGLLFQIGLAKIVKIDETFAQTLYHDGQRPDMMWTMGIGFCW